MSDTGLLRIGPAGWSYADWEGIVYPKEKPKGFDQLHYLAHYFDTIEINTTFYRPPASKTSESWVRRTAHNRDFEFTAKLWQKFTHEREHFSARDVGQYKDGVTPLHEARKLGAVLVQFPWSFKNEESNKSWLENVLDTFQEYPLVVEFRHKSWVNEGVFSMLRQREIGFANIDQPVIGKSIEPSAEVTSSVGYVRFHGRNYENWFKKGAGRDARYDYLYSDKETEEWIDKIKNLEKKAKKSFFIYNNHFTGKAVVNGLQLKNKLKGKKVAAPEPLVQYYPTLKNIVEAETPGENLSLF